MNAFLYKKKLFLNDKFAKNLQISVLNPYISCFKTEKGNIFLTSTKIRIKNADLIDYFDCKLLKEGWEIEAVFDFPWEKEYYFTKFTNKVFILQKKPIKKEVINDQFPKTKTIPRRRCKQTKTVQNMWNIKPSSNGKDANITNTLF